MDLLDVAAAGSPPMSVQTLTGETIRKWIARQPLAEKDDYLARFVAAEDPALAVELQRLIGNPNGVVGAPNTARTAGQLLSAAGEAADRRRRAEAARHEIEKARREHEAALARSKYLGDLARREPALWEEIDSLIATKKPASYDRAVVLLVDLREAAAAHGRESTFLGRLDVLRTEHARKPSLISKIQRAGLR
jgi:hypothetical protein